MERPKWIFWEEQGKWRGHPEGSPDREIQAGSFDELQFKVQQMNQEVAKSSRELPRVERPVERSMVGSPNRDALRYVLSQEQGKWRGHLEGYPNHSAQGESFDEVQFKLSQICRDLITGKQLPLHKAA
jgi:hypothetical protein